MALRARRQRRAPQPSSAPMAPGPSCKTCPRCGSTLFADMDLCYDCLYDFDNPGLDYSGSGAPYGPGIAGDGVPGPVPADGHGSAAPPSDSGYGGPTMADPSLGSGREPAPTVGPEVHREGPVPVPRVRTESVRSIELESAPPVEPGPVESVGSEPAIPYEAASAASSETVPTAPPEVASAVPSEAEPDLRGEREPVPSKAIESIPAVPSDTAIAGAPEIEAVRIWCI